MNPQDAAEKYKAADLPGFKHLTRKVCKAEWAYEVEVVFDGLDNFKAYMESDFRADRLKVMPEMEAFATGEVYSGNRVYDNFTAA